MVDSSESNAAVWKSEESVAQWVASAGQRERGRAGARRFLAALLPFAPDEEFTFVDLGAGTGAASRAVLDAYPGARAVLADYSPEMMAEGARALAPYGGRYRYVEFDLASGGWPEELAGELPAVISSLCVHHLPDERKRELFAEILQRLAPGAWFFNYDEVAAGEPAVEAIWQRTRDRLDPEAAARRANRTPEEQQRFENHVRHIGALDRQLGYLRTAGFEGIDVYWKELETVIYGGCRPPV